MKPKTYEEKVKELWNLKTKGFTDLEEDKLISFLHLARFVPLTKEGRKYVDELYDEYIREPQYIIFKGLTITNPTKNETGSFVVNPVSYYGMDSKTLVDVYGWSDNDWHNMFEFAAEKLRKRTLKFLNYKDNNSVGSATISEILKLIDHLKENKYPYFNNMVKETLETAVFYWTYWGYARICPMESKELKLMKNDLVYTVIFPTSGHFIMLRMEQGKFEYIGGSILVFNIPQVGDY